jgi:hypothetical protein
VGSTPTGPFLSVRELRHYFEIVLISWRTNPAAILLMDLNELYYVPSISRYKV